MTPTQFKTAIKKLGLSQERAGLFFGYSARHGQRWAGGQYVVPPAVDYCIRLMLEHGVMPGDLNSDFRRVG